MLTVSIILKSPGSKLKEQIDRVQPEPYNIYYL
jgi:hypothetical protein